MEINFEEICNKYEDCSECPLLIKQLHMSDPDYDYHNINICYKKEYNIIEKIQQFLNEYSQNTQSNCEKCLKKDECIVLNKEEVKNNCSLLVEKKENKE